MAFTFLQSKIGRLLFLCHDEEYIQPDSSSLSRVSQTKMIWVICFKQFLKNGIVNEEE